MGGEKGKKKSTTDKVEQIIMYADIQESRKNILWQQDSTETEIKRRTVPPKERIYLWRTTLTYSTESGFSYYIVHMR